jgi:hypothetical protein
LRGPGAIDHPHAGFHERTCELLDVVAVPVVIPEHGIDRRLQRPADLREQLGLLDLAVGRQVAREQDRVDLAVDAPERALELVAIHLVAVHVARRGDADRPCHAADSTD